MSFKSYPACRNKFNRSFHWLINEIYLISIIFFVVEKLSVFRR